jgi:hypothetical protein
MFAIKDSRTSAGYRANGVSSCHSNLPCSRPRWACLLRMILLCPALRAYPALPIHTILALRQDRNAHFENDKPLHRRVMPVAAARGLTQRTCTCTYVYSWHDSTSAPLRSQSELGQKLSALSIGRW